MHRFIKVIDSRWIVPGKKMLYEDEDGTTFLGPPIEYAAGEMIFAEVSERRQKDGYYLILKVITKTKSDDG